jgi:hypothetical protein
MSPPNPPPGFFDRLRRFDPTVLPIVIAAAVLIGAVMWLVTRPLPQPAPAAEAQAAQQIATLRAGVDGVSGRVAALEGTAQRLAALEARPAPDLGPVREQAAAAAGRAEAAERRAAALEERLSAATRDLAARPAVDPNAFAPRTALEGLGARLDTLQREQQAAGAQAAQRQAAAEGTLNGLAGRISAVEALGGRVNSVEQALTARIAALEATVAQRQAAIEAQAARLAALEAADQRLAGRADRLAAVAALRGALDAGQPLGAALGGLPEPPAPLTRFASTPPPTLATLRLSFEDAVRAARQAGETRTSGGVVDSAVSRLQGLVTVRRGEDLLVGDAANADIERARRLLEASDLEGALAALERLSPPARQAMRGWLDGAEALAAARAALRQLAAG